MSALYYLRYYYSEESVVALMAELAPDLEVGVTLRLLLYSWGEVILGAYVPFISLCVCVCLSLSTYTGNRNDQTSSILTSPSRSLT